MSGKWPCCKSTGNLPPHAQPQGLSSLVCRRRCALLHPRPLQSPSQWL